MTKTIAELWKGNLDPVGYLGKNNTEIKQLESIMQRNIEKLEQGINEKSKVVLEKYTDCVDEYTILVSEQSFCDGFCLGTKLAVEALTGAEQIL